MKRKVALSTTQAILLSFLAAVLVGSLLLSLPVSSASGMRVPYIDALFTATTSVCVTGLVTVPTASTWSSFGQVVILLLIQMGGLGVVTVMTGGMLLLNRRIGISNRLLIQDAFNLNTMSGLVSFVRKVLCGTFLIEGIGAVLYMFVFVPEFHWRGVWISVFTAISAFCNAGIDVIGDSSLCAYATNPLVNLTTAMLVIFGGIGYIVWWDLLRVFRGRRMRCRQRFSRLTLHSKIALVTTAVLLMGGAVLFLIFEYDNPLTLGSLSLWDKVQVAAFQSMTTRTAGFASVPQENLTNASAIVTLLFMFIGGSPVGTAGGVKTVTMAVLFYTALSMIRGRQRSVLFGRTLSAQAIAKAVAVVTASFGITFASSALLAAVTNASVPDILFETVSATATVGLSRSFTGTLPLLGKVIVICTMYLGRVGPISLALALGSRPVSQNVVKDPVEEISIG